MTASELIAALSEAEPDAEVWLDLGQGSVTLDVVTIDGGGVVLSDSM